MLECLLSPNPDLSHENGNGGAVLSTIIHGSENAPDWADAHPGQMVEVGVG